MRRLTNGISCSRTRWTYLRRFPLFHKKNESGGRQLAKKQHLSGLRNDRPHGRPFQRKATVRNADNRRSWMESHVNPAVCRSLTETAPRVENIGMMCNPADVTEASLSQRTNLITRFAPGAVRTYHRFRFVFRGRSSCLRGNIGRDVEQNRIVELRPPEFDAESAARAAASTTNCSEC